ncbi:conserved hypothetical protein [Hyella patelloides LEGE 07179]|uniref:Putative restriction endonuclease domain-containing protein n=1 Tax=Hyella patelloides LEGE 07179 TaxID=945734 RepID=A0A563W0I2_9CYAN|nr:Uma2 family endonuclease [Hyella patelloides]VEP17186.1 conserved hypothetical protein [Hyella patelloides LEGE 07179]
MIVQVENKNYTKEEYLALEGKAEYKSEYHNGKIISMTGGTTNHNRIVINLCSYLHFALKQKNAEVFAGDVRLWIPNYNLYTYPDAMAIKGKPIYEGQGTTTITNPLLIIEVLSQSTSSYDRGNKFRYYRSLPSFQEYILIDQYSYLVEQYIKTPDHKWLLSEYETQDSLIAFNSIDGEITLTDIYERVDFTTQNS